MAVHHEASDLFTDVFTTVTLPFFVLYFIIHHISQTFFETYRKLNAYDKNFWVSTTCTNVQASITTYTVLPILYKRWPEIAASDGFSDTFDELDWNLKLFL